MKTRGRIISARIELEKIVKYLSDSFGLELFFQLKKDVDLLKSEGIIDFEIHKLALKIIELGNKAAHKDHLQLSDAIYAEKHLEQLEKKLQERKLKFEKKVIKEPSFSELLGISKEKIKKENFADLLDEFEGKNKEKNKGKNKIKQKNKKTETKKITKEEYAKLIEKYDNIYFDDK